jgi:hypothetical protein
MISSIEKVSAKGYARIGGLAYLIIIIGGAAGELLIRNKMVVPGNAAATMNNIAASPMLWNIGIAGDLVQHIFDLVLAMVYYLLFRRVNKNLARLTLFFGLIQTAVLVANKLNLVIPVLFLSNSEYLKAFTTGQLQALAYTAIRAHGYGFGIGLIFFGCSCLVDGYLIFKSGFLPKFLGILLSIAGIGYLVNSFTLLLFPAYSDAIFGVVMPPIFLAELSMCLWLLIKGVNEKKWREWPVSDN